jgi:hypothetical protein
VRDPKRLLPDERPPIAPPCPGARGLPAAPRERLRPNKRRAKRLLEGIAVGWGDIYIPAKEGQSIDLVGYTPGEYDLVHRVNVGRVLRETGTRTTLPRCGSG